jgi:hypothetical protein
MKRAAQFAAFFLLALGLGAQDWKDKDVHVRPQSHLMHKEAACRLMKKVPISEDPIKAMRDLVRLVHNKKWFTHIHRDHLYVFKKKGFKLERFRRKLQSRLDDLEAIANPTREQKREIWKLGREISALSVEWAVFNKAYSKHKSRDWPFCLSGERYVQLGITDGCTSFAKTLITLANAGGLFDDIRLLISKRLEDLDKNRDSLGGKEEPPETLNGHQMVLFKANGKWFLVNETFYKEGPPEKFEIVGHIRGKLITPDNIIHKLVQLPSFKGKSLGNLVVGGVGRNRYDDLGSWNWAGSMRIGTSIPAAAVDRALQLLNEQGR